VSRPTVGITSYWTHARMSHWACDSVLVAQGYVEGVRLAGGRPVVIPADPHLADDPHDMLDLLDALCLVGGDDVAPELYGAERHTATGRRHQRRDAVELALVRAAVERDLPVLGICRGIQLLNVAYGGTLVQHIEEVVDQRPHRAADDAYGIHHVTTVEGSRLRQIVGERIEIHSHHHQGIGRVGEGLAVTAAADDGIIEGLEDAGRRFCVGVLWHPDAEPDGHGAPLFEALVSSAR
jgi:gamma-glutamyl-gamma-aminobutyrate hydrolase PuuD